MLNTYTTPPISSTTCYWVLVWGEGNKVASPTAVLTVGGRKAELGLLGISKGQLNLSISGPKASRWWVATSKDLKTWASVPGLESITLDSMGTNTPSMTQCLSL